jgi:Ni/Fe-hydrogenase subunit HybB-like protein
MKALLYLAVLIKHTALLIWVGGMLFFGIVAAPMIFAPDVITATGGTQIPGGIVSSILARFALWELVCGGLIVLCSIEIFRQAQRHRLARAAQMGIAVMMLVVAIVYTQILGPKMHDLRAEIGDFNVASSSSEQMEEFNVLHNQYEGLMRLNGLLGLGLFLWSTMLLPSAFRDRDRSILRSVGM